MLNLNFDFPSVRKFYIKNLEMKKIIFALAFIGLVGCQQSKMGYVDNVKLMNDYKEKVDLETKFKAKIEAFGKKRDSVQQAFQMEAHAFQVKAQKMAQAKAQEEYGMLQQMSQRIGQQLQAEEKQLQVSSQTEMDSLVAKVKREIKAYGTTNGFSYIFGGGDGGSVLYGSEADDLTDEITKILNDNYKK